VLEDTVERIYHANNYGDIPRGVFLIRGENVVLLGEIVSQPATNNTRFIVHNIAHLRNICWAGL
jgi:U6 snRNA-associated Sm-like protein LSm1